MSIVTSRGYTMIGLEKPIHEVNIGHALRAAGCFGANMVVISKTRYTETITDTQKSYKHVPLLEVDNLQDVRPYDCRLVGVELVDYAITLDEYIHPERAYYLFGPEESSLDDKTLSLCDDIVQIPSKYCLNLGACVNVVLYDRIAKQLSNDKHTKNRKEIFALQ
ncbi:MAG: RNA methyltransferase [Vampirovibrionia bacterium]